MGLVVGASAGFAAFAVGVSYMIRYRHLRIDMHSGWPTFTVDAVP
jgi:hypothetical protein